LGAAGCVTIHKIAETNLVGNTKAGKALNNNADHDPDHRGTAVEALYSLQLLHIDQLLSAMLESCVVCRSVRR